jgi:Lipid A core - O-antigen ligase and related enzymes
MSKSIGLRKTILFGLFLLMALYRAFGMFALRGINCKSNWLTPILPCNWAGVPLELMLWGVVILLFILELYWDHSFHQFFIACRAMWPVFIFVLLAGISSLWSIVYTITLYKTLVLLITTILAIYLGSLLDIKALLRGLTWFFDLVIVASFAFVVFLPKIGIMTEPFYKGAWEGVFWHRNYMGCFMAVSISLNLLQLLDWKLQPLGYRVLNLIMLLLGVFLLIKSKSATGIITAMALTLFCLLIAAWLKWRNHLKKIHYWIFFGSLVLLMIIGFTNLNFLFGLLGRDTSLTGRIPVWNYILQNVVSRRPVLGYGYSVMWNLMGVRVQLATLFNWTDQVLIGDNGFLDILLHLGVVGVLTILGLIVLGFVQGVRYFLHEKSIISFLPVLLLIFVLVANISLSLILESETIVWAMVIATQTIIQKKLSAPQNQ